MIRFITGLAIGALGVFLAWSIMATPNDVQMETRKCMTQQVHIINTATSAFIIIGEAVICAKDWQISDIYGPDAETFYGRIKLRDWDSKEFTNK